MEKKIVHQEIYQIQSVNKIHMYNLKNNKTKQKNFFN